MNKEIRKLKPFDPTRYDSIDLDSLVIVTIIELDKLRIELSIENIIVGAFKLFPKKFSLLGYPEFPEATRVEKSLWRSKGNKKQWRGGKTPNGYLITVRTRIIAEQTYNQLHKPNLKKPHITSRMRRKDIIMKMITNSPAYKKYIDEKKESITQADFCYLLQGTLDSSKDTLKQNLLSLNIFTEELKQQDLLQFLNWIEQQFKNFLENK